MKRWGIPLAVVAVAIAVSGGYGYYDLHRNDGRFGDPAVLQQIRTSTNCADLRKWADGVLTADSSNTSQFDLATGYSVAAYDRLEQVHC